MPKKKTPAVRRTTSADGGAHRTPRLLSALVALVVLVVAVGIAIGLGPDAARARGEEAGGAAEVLGATAEQTRAALEAAGIGKGPEPAETDLEVAQELPHQDLGREEALELAEGVFSTQLEEPAGIFDDLEVKKFLSDDAAVVTSASLEAMAGSEGEDGGAQAELPPEGSVLVESSIPLRTENDEGEEEAVDLSLEEPEAPGEALQPANPLVEVEVPAELGEGISLPQSEVGITVEGAPADQTPSVVEGQYAFYPNVATDTDLAVSPTATGVELMTDVRSAEASRSTTYELSLPSGASLDPGPDGSVEVVREGDPIGRMAPPSATDAAGEPVPATQEVDGDDLTVEISPGSSAQYPILVDPTYITEKGISEEWEWNLNGDTENAWTPSTDAGGLAWFRHAAWMSEGEGVGLDLSSGGYGNAASGSQAQWVYTVPRFAEDQAHGTLPTTYISTLFAEKVQFWTYGNPAYYPAMVIGLADPGSAGWWSKDEVWYGSYGDLPAGGFLLHNEPPRSDHATKAADFAYVTYENETPSKHRDSYVGHAAVAIVDEDPPSVLSLAAPSGWLTGPAAKTIAYSLEDTGLGVRFAGVRLAGEAVAHSGWGADFGCVGDVEHPCPRNAVSSESGRPQISLVPDELPTGHDVLEVVVSDPVGHSAAANVAVDIDNTAPEITLSGPLTEQEKLGITNTEYPLAISVTDGFEDDPPQSGVSSVEVKVDGKKITMPNETPWHPACTTRDCSFTGSWTLKASEYAAGDHEVEVIATDAVGHRSVETLEVELGTVPPQTSFTTPHPTFEEHEVPSIAFKATKGGVPVAGATFRCGLDGATMERCRSPHNLSHLTPNAWHTLRVTAVDKAGKADPTPAVWKFKTGAYPAAQAGSGEKLVYPEAGKKTASYYTLEAEWGENPEGKAAEGVKGVSFQIEWPTGETIPGEPSKEEPPTFQTVPAECVVDGQGRQVSWPLPAHSHPGHSAPVYLKVRGCHVFEEAGYPEKEIQFRAVFDGGPKVAGASEPAATEFVSRFDAARVSTDATESVGPANVDLLTGAFTLSRTDVSIPVPGYEANLEFTRTYSSTIDKSLPGFSTVLGGAWQPSSPLESEYEGEAWTRIEEKEIPGHPAVYGHYCWEMKSETWEEEGETGTETWEEEASCPSNVEENCPEQTCERWLEEEAQPREVWIELFDNEGNSIPFEISGERLVGPEWAGEISLRRVGEDIILAYPNGTHTTFVLPEGSVPPEGRRVYMPKLISYQANAKSLRMVYEPEPGGKTERLVEEISPTPVGGTECIEKASYETPGCRTLVLTYATGTEATSCQIVFEMVCPKVLLAVDYYGPSGNKAEKQTVASYGYTKITGLGGIQELALTAEVDPRTGLGERYTYAASSFQLKTLTPSGQSPWEFAYLAPTDPGGRPVDPGTGATSRLKSVSRGGATTTIAYEVPVKGAGAPYDMSSENIAGWGESDLPVDATAIFPPNHVPAEYPPHSYTGATIDYMDPEGYEINTASPSPPGVVGNSISTAETDVHGNVVRELDPQNRLLALNAADPPTRSHELDTHSTYSPNGNEMLESWGPLHQVRLSSGELVEARQHTVTRYDEGEPTPPVGTPWAYLPTKEIVAAVVPGKAGEFDPKVSETHYEWKLRKPEETIVDPGGLNIRTFTRYNSVGEVVETRQPKGVGGGTAGDTMTVLYTAGGTGECEGRPAYANLPCKVIPVAQAEGTGRPKLLWKKFVAYDDLGQPEEVLESPGGGTENIRRSITVYDEAGRVKYTKIIGGGTRLDRQETSTEYVYNPTTGLPTRQRFLCEVEPCAGFDEQATETTYNALGQVTKYEDADGGVTETSYDAYGRPTTVKDARGTETLHYDEASGVVTSKVVSGVGTFTATYDADGDLVSRGLPDGLTATTTYDQAGEPTKLAYTKQSNCGESCTWYEESLERSIEGQIRSAKSSLVSDTYLYDKAGRLTEARETPTEGECTTRHYTYDADSNRKRKWTRSPGVGGVCATTGGEEQEYEYDNADRLEGPTYDAWGRITSLPEEFAGGKPLTTTYFANDMVASQTQNGVKNTFQLDATGRQRQREQTGGVAGIEVFHYDGPGDSPSWTSLGSTWSRNVSGMGGELAAIQESSGTTTFKLTDLHGDAVASASSSPTAKELLATYRFTEFGEPVAGSAGRFGWLGGKARRTELASGVIQMGARSYIPQLGRFLTSDPVPGGSANAYDYVDQDPVNGFDLAGTCSRRKHCAASHQRTGARATTRTTRTRAVRRSSPLHDEPYGPPAPGTAPTLKPPRIPGSGNGPCPGPKCMGGPHHPTVPTATEGTPPTAHPPSWTLCQRYPVLFCPEAPDPDPEGPVGAE
jgi:RHS repeat-associated protein